MRMGPLYQGEVPDPLVYLERYGAYGQHRGLGMMATLLSHALRAAWLGEDGGADEDIALCAGSGQSPLDYI